MAIGWSSTFSRTTSSPLEENRTFSSLSELTAYVSQTSGTAYAGMNISVVGDGNNDGLYLVKGVGASFLIEKLGAGSTGASNIKCVPLYYYGEQTPTPPSEAVSTLPEDWSAEQVLSTSSIDPNVTVGYIAPDDNSGSDTSYAFNIETVGVVGDAFSFKLTNQYSAAKIIITANEACTLPLKFNLATDSDYNSVYMFVLSNLNEDIAWVDIDFYDSNTTGVEVINGSTIDMDSVCGSYPGIHLVGASENGGSVAVEFTANYTIPSEGVYEISFLADLTDTPAMDNCISLPASLLESSTHPSCASISLYDIDNDTYHFGDIYTPSTEEPNGDISTITDGATQISLQDNTLYNFTSTLSTLSVSKGVNWGDNALAHIKFKSGSSAPSVTLLGLTSSGTASANSHVEISILGDVAIINSVSYE